MSVPCRVWVAAATAALSVALASAMVGSALAATPADHDASSTVLPARLVVPAALGAVGTTPPVAYAG